MATVATKSFERTSITDSGKGLENMTSSPVKPRRRSSSGFFSEFGFFYFVVVVVFLPAFGTMSMAETSAPSIVPRPNLSRSVTKNSEGIGRFLEVFEVEEEMNSLQAKLGEPVTVEGLVGTNSSFHNKKWLSEKNETSRPPQQILPPDGYSFSSEWNIDNSNQTSLHNQGWIEYLEVPPTDGGSLKRKRRRRWVRSIQPISSSNEILLQRGSSVQSISVQDTTVNSTEISFNSSNLSTTSHKKKKKKKTLLTRLIRSMKKEFRFKGFGWTIVKSVLSKEAFGAGLKIPISLNFDVIERCPYIPIISSSCYLYYPWTAAAALTVSLPCEVLRHFLVIAIQFIQRWMFLLTLMVTSVKAQAVVPPIDAQLRFSKNVQERLELSFSWRLSKRKGYEFKVTSSYVYLPTLVYLHQTLATTFQTIVPRLLSYLTTSSLSDDELQTVEGDINNEDLVDIMNDENKFEEWLRQRTASMGLQVGCPIPDYSGFTCNLMCTLSGYYYSMKQISNVLSRKKSSNA